MGSGRGDDQHLRFRSDMPVELIKHSAADTDVIWAARVFNRRRATAASSKKTRNDPGA